METVEHGGNTYVSGIEDFHLGQTLECGQCFHFEKTGENEYYLNAKGRFLYVKQEKDGSLIFYDTAKPVFEEVWKDYFDLERDYGEIKFELNKRDDRLNDAMKSMWGIHILNQDFFEVMISFIISQNKQIPHIKKIVSELSARYGTFAGTSAEKEKSGVYYCFPTAEALLAAGEEGVRQCKTGFRAPYIIEASKKYAEGALNEARLRELSYEEAVTELMKVRGIGRKIADCIALFALGKRNAFPVDVWIKRTMECIYIGHEAGKKDIEDMAGRLFGGYGGYAQQYLFYYGRELKLGKISKKV